MKDAEQDEKVLHFKTWIVPELTRSELEDRAIEYYSEKLKLEFMIENGLCEEDMINDITMPHEI